MLIDRLSSSFSVNALKARLNQDSAGAAEQLEDMVRQIEEGKRDQQYENERALILTHFLRTISSEMFNVSDNATLLQEFDLERPHLEDDSTATPMPGDAMDSFLSPELLQKKRDLRKKSR
ncbi:hypothetical protein P43SY_011805 [Pythium insidiosum]|uniref:Uncharacterized protein n=1 Tax=Pythium insidiosum TaxID=114742 RepID=A0AAD5LY07_PYTIN|nr:hypothetical protein P43SY_011805 [Pythium insidiosum]